MCNYCQYLCGNDGFNILPTCSVSPEIFHPQVYTYLRCLKRLYYKVPETGTFHEAFSPFKGPLRTHIVGSSYTVVTGVNIQMELLYSMGVKCSGREGVADGGGAQMTS